MGVDVIKSVTGFQILGVGLVATVMQYDADGPGV